MQEKTINEIKEKTYDIEEALAYTKIKKRTFQNLNVSVGKERRRAKDGKEREVNVYTKSELDRVVEERNGNLPKGGTMQTGANPPAQVVSSEDVKNLAEALLAGFREETAALVEGFRQQTGLLIGGAPVEQPQQPSKKKIELAAFKDRLILNLTQAARLSGLGRDELIVALEEGLIKGKFVESGERRLKGKAVRVGRWKIYRESLEDFCRDYFNEEKRAAAGQRQFGGGDASAARQFEKAKI